ncbi:hypothetical protein Q8A67_022147 [Cirrhinus molitorella]|uniref:Uncharacterized protein n=1 Tax=Cirrhinus molitorella TaxID=172907 RepID=A0AA88P4Q7_9TELE|nr:hypothetical protein Q8A67_022147 [Cirrhinus molitorella]
MEFEEEPCGVKDEDTEEQKDSVEVIEAKHHWFQKTHFTNEDGNLVSQTQRSFTSKSAQKASERGSFTCIECGKGLVGKRVCKCVQDPQKGISSCGEEPCRMKDEDIEEQIDSMGLKEEEQHQFKIEDGNANFS